MIFCIIRMETLTHTFKFRDVNLVTPSINTDNFEERNEKYSTSLIHV